MVPDPLQMGGVPGLPELLIILLIVALLLLIPLGVGVWIARDARQHGSDHPLAWGTMAFLSGIAYLVGLVVFVVFYAIVRDDIGGGPAD